MRTTQYAILLLLFPISLLGSKIFAKAVKLDVAFQLEAFEPGRAVASNYQDAFRKAHPSAPSGAVRKVDLVFSSVEYAHVHHFELWMNQQGELFNGDASSSLSLELPDGNYEVMLHAEGYLPLLTTAMVSADTASESILSLDFTTNLYDAETGVKGKPGNYQAVAGELYTQPEEQAEINALDNFTFHKLLREDGYLYLIDFDMNGRVDEDEKELFLANAGNLYRVPTNYYHP